MLRVLDLFAGTGSATQAFEDEGHDVVRLELDERHDDIHLRMDIFEFVTDPESYLSGRIEEGWKPDVIWACAWPQPTRDRGWSW